MKIGTLILSILLVASVTWLALGQRQLRRELAEVRAQNRNLQQGLALSASHAPEAPQRGPRFASRAAPGNAAANHQAVARTQPGAVEAGPRRAVAPNNPALAKHSPGTVSYNPSGDALDAATAYEAVPNRRPPSSSHSPSGELLRRDWGPEQVVGPANTDRAGDIVTAWASRSPDAGEEWLHVNYDRMVDISEIRIRETYNPGAISKITAFLPNGQEVTVWEGVEPPAEAPVDTSFAPMTPVQASSVKVYLDTRRVRGWNEIDAIELVGADGSRQWATSATASSTYAE